VFLLGGEGTELIYYLIFIFLYFDNNHTNYFYLDEDTTFLQNVLHNSKSISFFIFVWKNCMKKIGI